MPVYEVLLSKAARKQLFTLPVCVHNKIIEDISALTSSPRPPGCKKLQGYKNDYENIEVINKPSQTANP